MLKNIVKKNRLLFKLSLNWQDSRLTKNFSNELNEQELKYLNEIKEKGVVAIPNFLSKEECELLINDFEKLDEKYAWYGEDKRIFGIEHLSENFKKIFHDNQMCKRIAQAYLHDDVILQTTMAAKLEPKENVKYGSGGGWHRDSFSRQFKAIVYLNDVSIDNGPFMYIHGSHTLENIKKIIDGLKGHIPGDYRYSNEEIKKAQEILNEKITYYTAPAGTLVLADIRGLHTGMPIKSGVRYSMFNYYISKTTHKPNNVIEQLAQKNINLKSKE